MFIDQWAENVTEIEVTGSTVEELLLLINWCSGEKVTYSLNVPNQNASGQNLQFSMGIVCNNMQAYELRKMWLNYLTKKGE
nr:MAG TPA: hypothetical protein [Caudoviricetes sp.]